MDATVRSAPALRRLRRRVAIAVLLAGASGLCGIALVRTRPAMERDLAQRATSAVALGGYRDVRVRYIGRDAVLRGVVRTADDRRRVVAIVRARQGTRSVDPAGLVVHPGAPAPEPVGADAP